MKIVVFTGAGISAESGLKTFRDSGGLWEGHDVMQVASPEGFLNNPGLVLDFYNERRRQLVQANPNAAHKALVKLEKHFDVTVITQNVDDLHERAGSSHVIHLHGELKKVRSEGNPNYIKSMESDLLLGDVCPEGFQLRPHIVWFGEEVPMMEIAALACTTADVMLVIGSSLQVYPAAGLIQYVPMGNRIIYVDLNPNVSYEMSGLPVEIIAEKASLAVPSLVDRIIKER
jgi:NAD-dependent deacetylase